MGRIKKGIIAGIGLSMMAAEAARAEAKRQLARYNLDIQDMDRLAKKATSKGSRVAKRFERTLDTLEREIHAEARSLAARAVKRGMRSVAKRARKHVAKRSRRRTHRR